MGNSSDANWQDFWSYVALFFTCTFVLEAFYVIVFLYNYKRTKKRKALHEEHHLQIELQDTHMLPPNWDPFSPSDGGFKIVSLSQNSSEFHHIARRFEETMPRTSYTITNIERIQNQVAWSKYRDCTNRMNSEGQANEKELFHGTRTTKPEDIYKCETGFDMRFSKEGMWGIGNYFAIKASYSHGYAHSCANGGFKQIFMAFVLTGYVYECPSNTKLRRPPQRSADSVGGITRLYDCVSGETQNSKVYITYENDRAYPAYLITYKGL